ncbi:MAG: dCMP deaminase family protein [Clostridia bacterium]|nr:dCMP deaminase family protein [Clostridia bacterium]
MDRVTKTNYYLDIAQTVLERSTCLHWKFGAIIVKNDTIVSTGYNGAPRGRKNCTDLGFCMCGEDGETSSELCRSVHAECNAIISATREQMLDSTMYLCGADAKTGQILSDTCSCQLCKRMIINAGISKVIVRNSPTCFVTYNVRDWVFNDDSFSGQL